MPPVAQLTNGLQSSFNFKQSVYWFIIILVQEAAVVDF